MFSFALLSLAVSASLTIIPHPAHGIIRNDGIHLAISPTCGSLSQSAKASDVNAGLFPLGSYKTIVSFGDSYTDGGVRDGSPPAPAVVIPPNPKAGGRTTNGPVWNEVIANDTGARYMDYAVWNLCCCDISEK